MNNEYDESRLLIEEIKKVKEFEDISDEEAEALSDNIYSIANILFRYYEEC